MTALIALELRRVLRRPAWPVTLVALLATVGTFVTIWGPTHGVPLWTATLLGQTTAAARVALAIFGTWLAAHTVALDTPAATARWRLVTGQRASRIQLARTLAALATVGAAACVVIPALWRAVSISGATDRDLAVATLHTIAFGLTTAALTAAARTFTRSAVGTWSVAMTLALALAVAIRVVAPMPLRLIALATLIVACGIVAMRTPDEEAAS